MMDRTRIAAWALAAAASIALGLPRAAAETWPTRPVTMVVTFAAGGPADGTARLIAGELSERLGQRVVVENKGGAGGNIGAASVAKAPADGYTLLLVTSGPGAVNTLIYKSLPYDPFKDFEPVVLVAGVPTTILVSPKLPVKDLKDLVAYGKQHRLSVGNPGYGTGGHIVAALFADTAGLEVTHVPYRGVGPMLTDVTSGQIDVGFAGFVPQILNMKAVAVTAEKRAEVLPNVPTVHEALGLDVVSGVWYGIFAPAGTPRDIVEKVNAGVNAFFKTPRGRELSKSMGMQPLGGTPEDMRTLMKSDVQRLKPVIEKAHIKMD